MTDSFPIRPAVFNLPPHVLYEIFLVNTWDSHKSLLTARYTSQVCSMWRDIVLRAPLIWSRSFELDDLDQKADDWRNTVLKRSGTSMLTITTTNEHRPESADRIRGRRIFLENLLVNHWDRIEHLVLLVEDIMDNKIIMEAMNTPTDHLKSLDIWQDAYEEIEQLKLFKNHAPSLRYLYLTVDVDRITRNLSGSPSKVTQNLRGLTLLPMVSITTDELLHMCIHMPHLEELEIGDITICHCSRCKARLPRPKMPHLRSMTLMSETIDIYPAFLDQIETAPDCSLSHDLELRRYNGYDFDSAVACMMRVLRRYAHNLFMHAPMKSDDPPFDSGTTELHVTSNMHFHFAFKTESNKSLIITLWTGKPENDDESHELLPHAIIAGLLEVVSLLGPHIGRRTRTLELKLCPTPQPNFALQACLLRAVRAMESVTNLTANFSALLALEQISGVEVVFPNLAVLTLEENYHRKAWYSSVLEHELEKYSRCLFKDTKQFFWKRYLAAPVETLEFSDYEPSPEDLLIIKDLKNLTVG